MQIGQTLRRLRKERNLTIEQLSAMTGLSSGQISQMERDMISPTLSSFWKVCQALDVPIHYFFDTGTAPDEDTVVVRQSRRRTIQLPQSNVAYHLLTPHPLRWQIEFLLVELQPGAASEETIAHQGEECGYVLEGRLKVRLGEREYVLEAGDSIAFNSTVPHRFINAGEGRCLSVWAMTPPTF